MKLLKFLEQCESKHSRYFWSVIVSIAITTNLNLFTQDTSLIIVSQSQEQNIAQKSGLKIANRDNEGFLNFGSNKKNPSQSNPADRGADRMHDRELPAPRFAFGLKKIGNDGSPGSSGSESGVNGGQIPDEKDWIDDPNFYDDLEKPEECFVQDSKPSTSLSVPVDFEYELDSNGNPTLLIPNTDSTRTMRGRTFNRVEHDQTSTHVHHMPDYGIPLPENFDLEKYKSMNKAEKIQYAQRMIPRDDIIRYQNLMGLSQVPRPDTSTFSLRGFAGNRQNNVGIVFQKIPQSTSAKLPSNFKDKDWYMSVTRDNGKHVSSYAITKRQLEEIMKDNFWVWPDKNFN